MKKVFVSILIAALVAFNSAATGAQQIPFVGELVARFEEFNKLYNDKLRAGANVAAFDLVRQRAEAAFKNFSVPAVMEVLAEGVALIQGKTWDEKQKLISSLAIESDRLVVEPNQELQVSVVRMFPTSLEKVSAAPVTVTIEIHPGDNAAARQPVEPAAQAQPPAQNQAAPIVLAKRLAIAATSTNSSRKLLLPDGRYFIVATVESAEQKIAEVRKPVYAISDFTARIAEMNKAIAAIKSSSDAKVRAVAHLAATPEFQLQRLASRNTTRGEEEINPFVEFDRIEKYLSALSKGQNPFAVERGELERAYAGSDGKLVPYRVYVPMSYDNAAARPLVVMLHGALGDERSYLSNLYDPVIIKGEAERRGYILAAPNGRGRLSTYRDLAGEDVLEVVKSVTRDYKIDAARVYLTGHSMGGDGTWAVASSNPDLFAAIAPVSGGVPAKPDALAGMLQKIKGVPALVIHGARDGLVPAERSRSMVAAAEKAGLRVTYIEVEDADHITVVGATFPAVMDFFEKNPKAAPAKATQD